MPTSDTDFKARDFFEKLWSQGDPWSLESSSFERAKYARQMELLSGKHFDRVLEIGCGTGAFTGLLASRTDHITAIEISPTAASIARRRFSGSPVIEIVEANVMTQDLRKSESWDLIVMSETIYYLGWLYPFFDVYWLACQLFETTKPDGHLLMANTHGNFGDALLAPAIIRTYRDLFVNVGYKLNRQENFHGFKEGVTLDVLISLFQKLATVQSQDN